MDFFSKSDPMCVMYTFVSGAWTEVGRTETIMNNHFPIWTRKFTLTYIPGQAQKVKFEVYDSDDSNSFKELRKQDYMGSVDTTMDVIMKSKFHQAKLVGGPKKQKATFCINAEILKNVTMEICGVNLKDLDTFSKSDPYFMIKQKIDSKKFKDVFTSEKIDNNLNPQWRAFSILDADLCDLDYDKRLVIAVYDWDDNSSDDLIGQCETTLNQLKTYFERGTQLELIHPKKKKSKRGMLRIKAFRIV